VETQECKVMETLGYKVMEIPGCKEVMVVTLGCKEVMVILECKDMGIQGCKAMAIHECKAIEIHECKAMKIHVCKVVMEIQECKEEEVVCHREFLMEWAHQAEIKKTMEVIKEEVTLKVCLKIQECMAEKECLPRWTQEVKELQCIQEI
jgi:hypothetical protein